MRGFPGPVSILELHVLHRYLGAVRLISENNIQMAQNLGPHGPGLKSWVSRFLQIWLPWAQSPAREINAVLWQCDVEGIYTGISEAVNWMLAQTACWSEHGNLTRATGNIRLRLGYSPR